MNKNSCLLAIKIIYLFVSASVLVGCTNYFTRKDCEKINWYQHGYEIAHRGQRPAQDETLNRCRKAEFNVNESDLDRGFKQGMQEYCKPEIVVKTGAKGEFFNSDLCDPGQAGILKQRHQEGVQQFCREDNGYPVGASGRRYNEICPENLKVAFLKEYKRGRAVFLRSEINAREEKMNLNKDQTSQLRNQLNIQQARLALLPQPRTVVTERYNEVSRSMEKQTSTVDPAQAQREDLQNNVNRFHREISDLENENKRLLDEKLALQTELNGL